MRVLWVGVLVTWALPSQVVAAESDEGPARLLFFEGRKLASEGKYTQACAAFAESLRLDPGVGTNFNLADCLEHVGRTASAWAKFLDVAVATKAANQTEKERIARMRAAALEPRLARLVVEVRVPTDGLTVERDGLTVAPTLWGVPMPADPGEHTIAARAPLRKGWRKVVQVPTSAETIAVSVPALDPEPAEALPSAIAAKPSIPAIITSSPAPPGPAERRRWTLPAIATGSLGLVGLATGAVFAVKFRSADGNARMICPSNMNCTPDDKTSHDASLADERRDLKLTYVGLGVGGAAALAAGFLWFRSGPSAAAVSPDIKVAARPTAWTSGLGGEIEVGW